MPIAMGIGLSVPLNKDLLSQTCSVSAFLRTQSSLVILSVKILPRNYLILSAGDLSGVTLDRERQLPVITAQDPTSG